MTADTADLRGAKASVDAWIALRVTIVAAKTSEVILVERVLRIPENMLNGIES
jgi:curli biogenesis system outer membrane secretion channel CsgG